MALNEIFIRGVEMKRQVQEESFTTAQCTVESIHQVVKEIVFDDEYEPLEEVEEEVQ